MKLKIYTVILLLIVVCQSAIILDLLVEYSIPVSPGKLWLLRPGNLDKDIRMTLGNPTEIRNYHDKSIWEYSSPFFWYAVNLEFSSNGVYRLYSFDD